VVETSGILTQKRELNFFIRSTDHMYLPSDAWLLKFATSLHLVTDINTEFGAKNTAQNIMQVLA
jgi:hypothetical protein